MPDTQSNPPTEPLPTTARAGLADLPVGTRVGRYALVRQIARGASGVVYEARDLTLGRALALKLLDAQGEDPTHVARLRREAGLAASLRHPHVITIHETGQARVGGAGPPVPFIAMDYLSGDTLAAARTRLDRARQLELLRQVALGVGHAHAHGVVHRDLKPSNVLLSADDRAVVTDFGLARGAGDVRLTHTGERLGTPAYMAPEQVSGRPDVDARADVWALGVMLYEILTGRRPFGGPTIQSLFGQILCSDPLPPRRLNRQLPRALEAVCLKALAREPAQRYDDASAVALELGRWQRGEPVEARPIGLLGRIRRRVRRRPARWAGALAALALLLPGLAYGGWQLRRTRRHAALAAQARAAAGRADWTVALAACRAALDQRPDAELAALAARCAAELDRARAAAAARHAARAAERARAEQLQHVRRLLRDTRPLLYRRDADARGALLRLTTALAALEPTSDDADGERWALLGSGWTLVGWDRRALVALRAAVRLRPDDPWVRRDLARVCLRRAFATMLVPTPGGRRTRPSRAWIARARTHLSAAASGWAGAREIDRHLARAYAAVADERPQDLRRLCAEGQRRFEGEPGAEQYWAMSGWTWRDKRRQLADWTEALARRPHDAWVRVLRSTARSALGDAAGARRDLEAAIALNPYLAIAYVQRAQMHEDAGDLAAAEADLDRAVVSAPDVAWVRDNRGHVRDLRGNTEGALADFARAIALDPEEAGARYHRALVRLRTGRPAQALADLDAAIARIPGWVIAHIERAKALRRLNRDAEAKAVHDDIVRLAPDDPRGYFLRAGVLAEAGDLRAAIDEYGRALERDARFGPAYANRGRLRRRTGDPVGAEADFRQGVALMPRSWTAHFNLGYLLYGLGRYSETAGCMERTLALNPRLARAHLYLGAARLGLDLLDPAVGDLDRALQLDPGLAMAYQLRGTARRRLGRLDAARADLDRLIELAPKDPVGYLERARIWCARKDLPRALADLDRTLELAPSNAEARLQRGSVHAAAGRHAEAAADFRAVTELQPRDWRGWNNLGHVLWTLGARPDAVRSLREARRLAPPDERDRIDAWLDRNAHREQ